MATDPKHESPAQKADRERAEAAKKSPNAAARQQEGPPMDERSGGKPGAEPPPLGSNIANPGGAPPEKDEATGEA